MLTFDQEDVRMKCGDRYIQHVTGCFWRMQLCCTFCPGSDLPVLPAQLDRRPICVCMVCAWCVLCVLWCFGVRCMCMCMVCGVYCVYCVCVSLCESVCCVSLCESV